MLNTREHKSDEALHAGQNRILERIAKGAPTLETLREIVLLIEANCPGARCGLLLLGADGVHVSRAVGPNLPASYAAGVVGHAIGPSAGSCGAAMYHKKPIIVEDVSSNPLWKDYREFAAAHGVKACWSTPIVTPQGRTLGAFGMHYCDSRAPNVGEERLAEIATRLAGVAIERELAEESLRESEERLRLVALATRDAIYDWDIRNDVCWPNESYRESYAPDLSVSLNYEWWRDRIDPLDRTRVIKGLEDAFRNRRTFWSDNYSFRRSDSTYAVVMDRGSILYDPSGEAVRMIGAMTDITAHREYEKALRASETRYRNVVETQTELICRFLPDTTLTFVNDAYCRHFGKTREELIGKSFLRLVPGEERTALAQLINSVLEGRHFGPSEQMSVQADGSICWILWRNRVLRDTAGNVELQGIGRDITEQKRAEDALRKSEEELRRSHAQIRQLVGSLMKAQEAERRHIARELHDDLNQQVAGLSISLSELKRQLPRTADSLLRQVAQIQERAHHIANDIRNLSHKLHPAALEHAGLIVALKSLVAEFSGSTQIEFDLRMPEYLAGVPDDVAICIYRIAQESVRNMVKHSCSRRVKLELSVHQDCIDFVIADDGCGFELEGARKKGGLGLISMAERVCLLQGTFDLQSKPGQGTCIRATVPLKSEQTG